MEHHRSESNVRDFLRSADRHSSFFANLVYLVRVPFTGRIFLAAIVLGDIPCSPAF